MDKLLKNFKLEYIGRQKAIDGSIYAYCYNCLVCGSTLYFMVADYTPSKVYQKMLEHKKHCKPTL